MVGTVRPDEASVLATLTRRTHTNPDTAASPDLYLHDRSEHVAAFGLAESLEVAERNPEDLRAVLADQMAAAQAARTRLDTLLDTWTVGDPVPLGVDLLQHIRNRYDGADFQGRSDGKVGPHGALTRSEELVTHGQASGRAVRSQAPGLPRRGRVGTARDAEPHRRQHRLPPPNRNSGHVLRRLVRRLGVQALRYARQCDRHPRRVRPDERDQLGPLRAVARSDHRPGRTGHPLAERLPHPSAREHDRPERQLDPLPIHAPGATAQAVAGGQRRRGRHGGAPRQPLRLLLPELVRQPRRSLTAADPRPRDAAASTTPAEPRRKPCSSTASTRTDSNASFRSA